jgi:peptidyl-tRNA hydrolase
VRADLCPGDQLAQAWHAGVDFSVKYPALVARWHQSSNNVVIVAVPDEGHLLGMETTALALGLRHHLVEEPDMDGAFTAIALEPGQVAKRMCARLPLALKEPAMT